MINHPSAYMWQQSLSTDNQFCEAVVNAGFLTHKQMLNASCRYCIGTSKRGGVIFWQIDHEGRVHDGKVMYYQPDCHRNKDKRFHPTWVSAILARREAALAKSLNLEPTFNSPRSSHCFFGLHLLMADGRCMNREPLTLNHEPVICIVESEKSAFILSELFPQHIWLASGGLGEVQPDKFHPLRGRRVVMFPDTDPDGIAFRRWTDAASQVMRTFFWEDSPPIHVSQLLELHATKEQKERKIDLVDFLFEEQTDEACKPIEFCLNSRRLEAPNSNKSITI